MVVWLQIWRIQNLPLWNFYSFHKNRLRSTGSDENERHVWHGTSGLDPAMIYNDQQGDDHDDDCSTFFEHSDDLIQE